MYIMVEVCTKYRNKDKYVIDKLFGHQTFMSV